MERKAMKCRTPFTGIITAVTLTIALAASFTYHSVQAQRQPPSEHKGVEVKSLGVISGSSMEAQLGLKGYRMQLREITLAPGGQIARHGHANRPGLVWTLDGTWTEGRPEGEKDYPASLDEAILEDATTDHWFWNDSAEPVRVVVCDIVPAQ
jgi:quercetin dioxygenase-like cupin family protein